VTHILEPRKYIFPPPFFFERLGPTLWSNHAGTIPELGGFPQESRPASYILRDSSSYHADRSGDKEFFVSLIGFRLRGWSRVVCDGEPPRLGWGDPATVSEGEVSYDLVPPLPRDQTS